MACLVGCLAMITPRLVLLLVAIFGQGYLERAYDRLIWPLLGFLFMPITTLAYAWAINSVGRVEGLYLVVLVVAVVLDLSMLGGGGLGGRKRYRKYWRG